MVFYLVACIVVVGGDVGMTGGSFKPKTTGIYDLIVGWVFYRVVGWDR